MCVCERETMRLVDKQKDRQRARQRVRQRNRDKQRRGGTEAYMPQ